MARKRDVFWKYAPLWATLFGASATLLKKLGTHYIMERDVQLEWSDFATAVVTAGIGYVSFRKQYGNKLGDSWATR